MIITYALIAALVAIFDYKLCAKNNIEFNAPMAALGALAWPLTVAAYMTWRLSGGRYE